MNKEYEIVNAVIESAEICIERGTLDAWLHLDYGGTSQGFGGYALYLSKTFKHHNKMSVAGHHIYRIMELAGVEKWSQLKGKTIRVKHQGWGSTIHSIGHIIKNDWFCPKEEYENLRNETCPKCGHEFIEGEKE